MDDIELITDAFYEYIQRFNFWQYYVLDIKKEKEVLQGALSAGNIQTWEGPDVQGKSVPELATILRAYRDGESLQGLSKYAKRHGVNVDGAVAAGFVLAARGRDADLVDTWGQIVDALNLPLYKEWEDDVNSALENIKNRLKYTRLEDHGPKIGEITRKSVFSSVFLNEQRELRQLQISNYGVLLCSYSGCREGTSQVFPCRERMAVER
jgi:glycogen debranching enzyme